MTRQPDEFDLTQKELDDLKTLMETMTELIRPGDWSFARRLTFNNLGKALIIERYMKVARIALSRKIERCLPQEEDLPA